ncbi:4,5-dihydroxyphthalate decarboxylase [Methylobacterium sp. WL64]|uniref:4,5-dihydroxyphthalate decarboxylase n=1 Tax=Methylobacterium sp. WL64 TaxID=2603894 RepID=UPI0011CB3DAE|nr:4,5-dihydroxyphthalate decarboxylase [Methylobacterium sp. WL64]TXN00166.1 4,5-dihydroxyphthalate decarboxylase [Methylobacterium sp. WL64]
MSGKSLDIAFWNYDRTRALSDRRVRIEGVEPRYHTAQIVPQIFERMIRQRAYDVSELGLTYFLRTFANGPSPFLAIPVFPNRCFRHSAIYVGTASGIERPQDLVGRTIGELALYGHDAGVMPKGILSDEFGFRPERNRWIVGDIDFPMDPIDFVPHPHPAGVDVSMAPKGTDLGALLEAGAIDALISADVPRCVLDGSPKVRRLFPDYEAVERDYYRRTGIFPIMHTVVVTRELAEQEPDIVRAVYKGFCDAKATAVTELAHGMSFNNMSVMVPWLTGLLARDRELLGDDWWPYGMSGNRAAIDAVLRYHHEQGLTDRRFRAEEIFVPYLIDN